LAICPYALEQHLTHSPRTLAPEIQEELDTLLKADLVISNFPIYWFSMPTIMNQKRLSAGESLHQFLCSRLRC
jgi:putative NADPH-quinone reductase